MQASSTRFQTTALYETHIEAGARMVPFAGWEMPLHYKGVLAEVRAVREGCGLFDMSHRGQLRFEGVGVTQWLNTLVSTDWETVAPGRAAAALLLNEDGGVLDEIMGYRLSPDAWLIVVNAGRAAVDEAHSRRYLVDGIEVSSGGDLSAMIELQGPQAASVMQHLIGESLHDVELHDVILLAGTDGVMARGGSTGGNGFQILFNAPDAPRVWEALLGCGVTPCGLGAYDVLRLEAGLPLYGNELRETWTPDDSGLSWIVDENKPNFTGRDAFLERRAVRDETSQTIRMLRMNGKAIPREGYRVLDLQNNDIGEVTSGAWSPTFACGIALAAVPQSVATGDEVQIEIRGVSHSAAVVSSGSRQLCNDV
jgi:aminomethyltransferase